MHCPRCGAEALTQQQFCRSCGFNLERVVELIADQPPANIPDMNIARAHARQRQLEHWAGVAGLATMTLVLVTLIYLIVSEMMIRSGKIGTGLLLLIMIAGGAFMLGLQGYSKSLKQRLVNRSSNAALPESEPTRKLEPHREPAQSVTEYTTELLPARRNINTSPGQNRSQQRP